MSLQSTNGLYINPRISTLRIIGGNDCNFTTPRLIPDLFVLGGARIKKNALIGGDLQVKGNLTLEQNLTLTGNIEGGLTVNGGNLEVFGGNILIEGSQVVGPRQADIANLISSLPGSVDGTLDTVGNTAASDESANINENFLEIETKINAMLDSMRIHGLIG